ncbi:MAG: hypothetical protein J7483_06575 [Novosphingobium sp.]|nr:hypothetical protein [Novosphingobium sp.]
MKHETFETDNAAPADVLDLIQQQLATLAAGLDVRFVHAGTMLATSVETIDRVLGALDRVLHAIDDRTANEAVRTMRDSAKVMEALPAIQDERVSDVGVIRRATTQLQTHLLEIQEMLSVLRVNGTNLRIIATESPEFGGFVTDMFARFDTGDFQLEGFSSELRELTSGVASVQRVARLLAVEVVKVIPMVPNKLADDAFELQAHQAVVGQCAASVARIARLVQEQVGVVLGALQIGDITRQRVEHCVGAMRLAGVLDPAEPGEGQARAHVLRLLAAQITDIAADFEDAARRLLGALRDLGPETQELIEMMEECGAGGDGRGYLFQLEQGIGDIDALTGQLRAANERAHVLSGLIANTMDSLTNRLDAVRAVRTDIQQIALLARGYGRTIGVSGRQAVAVAQEIDASAERMTQAVNGVGWAIRELAQVSLSIRHRQEFEAQLDAGLRFGKSLAHLREACRRTAQGVGEGGLDAHELVEWLEEAAARLRSELALGGSFRAAAAQLEMLADEAEAAAVPNGSDSVLRMILERVGTLYSMAREREVHRGFLLPGMDFAKAPPVEEDEDGLF